MPAAAREVDVVVAGAAQSDGVDTEVGEASDRLGPGVVVDEDAHRGKPRSRSAARIEAGLEVLEVVAVLRLHSSKEIRSYRLVLYINVRIASLSPSSTQAP